MLTISIKSVLGGEVASAPQEAGSQLSEFPPALRFPLADLPAAELIAAFTRLKSAVIDDLRIFANFANPEFAKTQNFNLTTPYMIACELCPTFPRLLKCADPAHAKLGEVLEFLHLLPSLGMPLNELFVVNMIGLKEPSIIQGQIDRASWKKSIAPFGGEIWHANSNIDCSTGTYVTWRIDNMLLVDQQKLADDSHVPFSVLNSGRAPSACLMKMKGILEQEGLWSPANYHALFGRSRIITEGVNCLGIDLYLSSNASQSHGAVAMAELLTPDSPIRTRLLANPDSAESQVLCLALKDHYGALLGIRAEMKHFLSIGKDLLAVASFYDFIGFKLLSRNIEPAPGNIAAYSETFALRLISSGLAELGVTSEDHLVAFIELDHDPKLMAARAGKTIQALIDFDFLPLPGTEAGS